MAAGLRASLVFAIVATAAHFVHNALAIRMYPEPAWITPADIAANWAVMTLIGLVGFVLYRRGAIRLGATLLYAYAVLVGAGVLHYHYGPASRFTLLMHALIIAEVLASVTVITSVTWALVRSWRG